MYFIVQVSTISISPQALERDLSKETCKSVLILQHWERIVIKRSQPLIFLLYCTIFIQTLMKPPRNIFLGVILIIFSSFYLCSYVCMYMCMYMYAYVYKENHRRPCDSEGKTRSTTSNTIHCLTVGEPPSTTPCYWHCDAGQRKRERLGEDLLPGV